MSSFVMPRHTIKVHWFSSACVCICLLSSLKKDILSTTLSRRRPSVLTEYTTEYDVICQYNISELYHKCIDTGSLLPGRWPLRMPETLQVVCMFWSRFAHS